MSETDPVAAARAWITGDPDPDTRAELEALIDAGAVAELTERMAGTLEFGTAGIRGVVGAGSARMNRAVVIRTTRGLADYLIARHGPNAGPVVVGFDARLSSRQFATDTVDVLTAAGLDVRTFADPVPTPIVAYAAGLLDAVAAVVITASHNPPEYNGYKVYDATRAQIVPPVDGAIAAAIAAVGPATEVPREGGAGHAAPVPDDVFERYLTALHAARPDLPGSRNLSIVYTPLHGVGGRYVLAALADAGYEDVQEVEEQFAPDGHFPTVAFPNPEEPGALDLAIATAGAVDAELILANDPDTDRLAVALPRLDGTWALLTGNQIGVLLADFLLTHAPSEPQPLVVSSIVSSPMLGDIAAVHGARVTQTLTGFKWICNAAFDLERDEGVTFVFGYEEALGYSVGTAVRDKDGISAAVVFADLAAVARDDGETVWDRLHALYRRHGLWISGQTGVTRPGTEGQQEIAAAMGRLAAEPPDTVGGIDVVAVTDFSTGAEQRPRWLPATELIALDLGPAGRVLARPSGTEPKLKIYVDLRGEVGDHDPFAAEDHLRERAAAVGAELAGVMGLG